jgi:hypothetical protein
MTPAWLADGDHPGLVRKNAVVEAAGLLDQPALIGID